MSFLNFILIYIIIYIFFTFFVFDASSDCILSILLLFTLLIYLYTLVLFYNFDSTFVGFNFITYWRLFDFLNIGSVLAIDAISMFFLLLLGIIAPLCFIWDWYLLKNNTIFSLLLFFIFIVLFLNFIVMDLFAYFLLFECLLLPMFFIIGFWGSRLRKIKATYYLALYTIFGSIFLLIGIFILYSEYNSTSIFYIYNLNLPFVKQMFIWICLFIGFSVKVPMFPFHIWLPEAHVEAPTVGSVILAAFILKLGGYAFLRFIIFPFWAVSLYFLPIVFILTCLGLTYASLSALRQLDIKKIVAYSSIAHMNLGLLGLFSFNLYGLEGSFIVMLAHGLVSSALFFLIGALYSRYHTKLIYYYSGLTQVMPLFSFYFLFFSFANFGFPGTLNFIGEILLLLGIFKKSVIFFICIILGLFLSTAFSIVLANRILFGQLPSIHLNPIRYINFKFLWFDLYIQKLVAQDLSKREVAVLLPLAVFTLLLGLFPEIVLSYTYLPFSYYLQVYTAGVNDFTF